MVEVVTVDGITADDALRLAASVEQDAEHPIARAIVRSAHARGLEIPPATAFEAIPGHGVTARVEGRELHVGGPNLLDRLRVDPQRPGRGW